MFNFKQKLRDYSKSFSLPLSAVYGSFVLVFFLVGLFVFQNSLGQRQEVRRQADEPISIEVLNPNGGETLIVGQDYQIQWAASPNVDMVTIGYSSGPGHLDWIAYNLDVQDALALGNDQYEYTWTVDVGNTTNNQFKIEIIAYDTGSGLATDQSDEPFFVLATADECLEEGETGQPPDNCCENLFPRTYRHLDSQGFCAIPADGTFICSTHQCGNNSCEGDENECNCPDDCPEPANLQADFNQDGQVNAADYSYLVSRLYSTDASADITGRDGTKDSQVDIWDYSLLIKEWVGQL